jgi:hypothetical protein
MLKYLRIAVTALSLTACVLLVALWVRSYWWADDVGTLSIGGHEITADSYCGTTTFFIYENANAASSDMYFDCYEIKEYYDKVRAFFDYYRIEESFWDRAADCIVTPHWFWVSVSLSIGAFPWIHWSKRFSLRTLLIATTLVALGLGVVIYLAR